MLSTDRWLNFATVTLFKVKVKLQLINLLLLYVIFLLTRAALLALGKCVKTYIIFVGSCCVELGFMQFLTISVKHYVLVTLFPGFSVNWFGRPRLLSVLVTHQGFFQSLPCVIPESVYSHYMEGLC